jgi:hypothetical protein
MDFGKKIIYVQFFISFIYFITLIELSAKDLPRVGDFSKIKSVIHWASKRGKDVIDMEKMYKALKEFNNKKLENLLKSGANPNI